MPTHCVGPELEGEVSKVQQQQDHSDSMTHSEEIGPFLHASDRDA